MSGSLAITSDVAGAMARVTDEVSRVTREEIVSGADRALANIRADWPVDTGTSRDAFVASGEPYGASIRCPVGYAGYINQGRAEARAIQTAEAEVAVALARAAERIGR